MTRPKSAQPKLHLGGESIIWLRLGSDMFRFQLGRFRFWFTNNQTAQMRLGPCANTRPARIAPSYGWPQYNTSNHQVGGVKSYLLGPVQMGSYITIPLAEDSGMTATSNSIHLPVSVVIVHNMNKAPAAPTHRTPKKHMKFSLLSIWECIEWFKWVLYVP